MFLPQNRSVPFVVLNLYTMTPSTKHWHFMNLPNPHGAMIDDPIQQQKPSRCFTSPQIIVYQTNFFFVSAYFQISCVCVGQKFVFFSTRIWYILVRITQEHPVVCFHICQKFTLPPTISMPRLSGNHTFGGKKKFQDCCLVCFMYVQER